MHRTVTHDHLVSWANSSLRFKAELPSLDNFRKCPIREAEHPPATLAALGASDAQQDRQKAPAESDALIGASMFELLKRFPSDWLSIVLAVCSLKYIGRQLCMLPSMLAMVAIIFSWLVLSEVQRVHRRLDFCFEAFMASGITDFPWLSLRHVY
eukprot:scaffold31504_cov15-Prasinocladus_malaysianus.AAC.1